MKPMELKVERSWIPVIEETKLSDGAVQHFAFHPLIPGVNAHGGSKEEAAQNWQEALQLYLDHCAQNDLPRPAFTYFRVKLSLGEGGGQASQDEVTITAVNATAACA